MVGAGWLLVVMVLTVGFSHGSGSTVNLQLGHRLTRDDVANVIMFLPAGILLALAGAGWPSSLIVGFLGSVAIETTQYVARIGRVSDVNDILTNTVGAVLGYVLVRLLSATRQVGRSGLQPERDGRSPASRSG